MVTLLSMVTTMATRHHNQSASRVLWKLPLQSNLSLMVLKLYAMGPRSLVDVDMFGVMFVCFLLYLCVSVCNKFDTWKGTTCAEFCNWHVHVFCKRNKETLTIYAVAYANIFSREMFTIGCRPWWRRGGVDSDTLSPLPQKRRRRKKSNTGKGYRLHQ